MVSFLFTDIEGSTRLFRRLGADYPLVLAEHNRLLRDVWSDHGGYEVKTEGDSFFIAFESAAAALEAAVAAQTALGMYSWPKAEPRIRVGVHSGLAAPIEGDYVALAVHQAARVVGAAHGGQILATEAAVTLASDEPGVTQQPLGHYRLRGFDDPVRLYEVSAPGQRSEFPPIRAIPADGHNIIRPLTSFVGRDQDLAGIGELLSANRQVTVMGTGGVGKTRVAMEVGTRLATSFEGGVWFADLSPAEPKSPVGGAIADAVGVQPDGHSPIDALIEHFGSVAILLILDTCEHVRDSAREASDRLLRGSPKLTILATSRVPLGLDYERIWQLDPLPTGLERGGAEQLFVERLGSPGQGPEESEAVRQICQRLDGIPLAIELAAARGRTSSAQAVLATLDDPSRFLRVRQPGADPRQESLAAIVDWSFGLLKPTEQIVFLRLGIFAASFSEDTGRLAAGDDSIGSLDVVEAIWSLADHSLLERVTTANETRYRMLETIRTYAIQHIEQSEQVETATRLAAALLDRVGPWLPTTDGLMNQMRVEVDNLRALISILRDEEPEMAQLLALSVSRFLDHTADYVSGAREADQYVSDLRAETTVRPLLFASAAGLHHRLGNFDTEELLQEARQLRDRVGTEPDWASGWVGTAHAQWLDATGQTEAAIAMATEALQQGDLPEAGRRAWLGELGLMVMPDDPALAVEYLEQGLSITPGDRLVLFAGFHSNIAEALMRLDEPNRAAAHQLEALRVGAQLGVPLLVAVSLIVAARLRALESAWEGAVRLHAAADSIIEESGATLYPDDVELSEQMLSDARDHVGDAYQRIWDPGYQLAIGDAADEGINALEEIAARTTGP